MVLAEVGPSVLSMPLGVQIRASHAHWRGDEFDILLVPFSLVPFAPRSNGEFYVEDEREEKCESRARAREKPKGGKGWTNAETRVPQDILSMTQQCETNAIHNRISRDA